MREPPEIHGAVPDFLDREKPVGEELLSGQLGVSACIEDRLDPFVAEQRPLPGTRLHLV